MLKLILDKTITADKQPAHSADKSCQSLHR